MKLPSQVKIGGHNYTVKFPFCFKERADIQGQADHCSKEIRVANSEYQGTPLADSKIAEIFIHETLHSISATWNAEVSEAQCKTLAEGIYAFLVDNGYLGAL